MRSLNRQLSDLEEKNDRIQLEEVRSDLRVAERRIVYLRREAEDAAKEEADAKIFYQYLHKTAEEAAAQIKMARQAFVKVKLELQAARCEEQKARIRLQRREVLGQYGNLTPDSLQVQTGASISQRLEALRLGMPSQVDECGDEVNSPKLKQDKSLAVPEDRLKELSKRLESLKKK